MTEQRIGELQPEPKPASELPVTHEIQLVHAEAGRRVVLVQAKRNGQLLDAALGEAATAEEAEDRARQRLKARRAPRTSLDPASPKPSTPSPAAAPPAPPIQRPSPEPIPEPQPVARVAPPPPEEPPVDPEDWSSELARLDLQLRRLGWDRDQEGIYLGRVFGHPDRNRLTHYGDLLAYLQALESLEVGQDPASAPAPLRRRDLLNQCDQLLSQLQWDPGQGRAFLEQHFSLASRQQLSDAQLLQFNMLLESEWLSQPPAPSGAAAGLGRA